jgi:hypothetical protein
MDNAQLRIENDILKLAMQAEFGAEFMDFADIPPEVENNFLKMVRKIEEMEREAPLISVFDFVGRPLVPLSDEIAEDSINAELEKLYAVLEGNDLSLVSIRDYPPRHMYKFITEELFPFEMQDVRMPGMVGIFCYEDFHFEPEEDIRGVILSFLYGWEKLQWRNPKELIEEHPVQPGGNMVTQESLIRHMIQEAGKFSSIQSLEYNLHSIEVKWTDELFGMGYALGEMRYMATFPDGSEQWFEGECKFCCGTLGEEWRLHYFQIPGFTWNGKWLDYE